MYFFIFFFVFVIWYSVFLNIGVLLMFIIDIVSDDVVEVVLLEIWMFIIIVDVVKFL